MKFDYFQGIRCNQIFLYLTCKIEIAADNGPRNIYFGKVSDSVRTLTFWLPGIVDHKATYYVMYPCITTADMYIYSTTVLK